VRLATDAARLEPDRAQPTPSVLVRDAEESARLRAVVEYLAYAYVPGRSTLVEDVFEVLPGEIVTFRGGELTQRTFWELPREPERFDDEETLERALRAGLERSLKRALPSEGRAAASLSGGIDSSLVVALVVAEALAGLRIPSSPIAATV